MIKLTKLNQSVVYVNPDLIEFIEETPDTIITLTTGIKLNVEERASQIVDRIIDFRRLYFLDRPDYSRPQY